MGATLKNDRASVSDRYRLLVSNLAVGVFVSSVDGRLLEANDAVAQMAGYASGAELCAVGALKLYADLDDRRRMLEALRAHGLVRGLEMRSVRKDGSTYWITLSAFLQEDERGEPTQILGIVEDVSARKRVEQALVESEGRLREAQRIARLGHFFYDLVTNVWTSSQVLDEIFGIDERFSRSFESWLRLVHPDDRDEMARYVAEDVIAGRRRFDHQYRIVRYEGGEVRWVHGLAEVELGPSGEVARIFGTIQDVTRLRETEEALRNADRRKNDFLAMLSHELRNPLAPIRAGLYLMERAPPGAAQAVRAREVISRQVDQLTKLVDDLLDVTRIVHGRVQLRTERLALGELVRRTADDHGSLFEARGVKLGVALPKEPLHVAADRTRVAQCIGNLLGNALKFTGAGGHVDVTLGRENDMAVLRVRDDGVGIASDVLAELFEPFAQARQSLDRSQGGLGLGLMVSRALIEQHGGTVTAASDGPGRGAEFTIRLPLAGAAAIEHEAGVAVASRRRRILVIEDNADTARCLTEALELMGHEADYALDGRQGLERARAFRPEVVLCDVGLPVMDGYAVARAFRADESLGAAVLVALTGYASPDDRRQALDAGFAHHLGKPPNFDALERLLADC